jgi:hypothetical protein
MEGSAMSSARRRPLLAVAVLVLLLLAVAVASTGSVPTGSGGARRPSDRVLDVGFSLFLLLMGFGVLLWGYILLFRRDVAAEARASRSQRRPWVSIIVLVLVLGIFGLAVRWFTAHGSRSDARGVGLNPPDLGVGAGRGAATAYNPEFTTGPVLLVLVLLAVMSAAWYSAHRAARRRRLSGDPESLLPALADVLEETLDDLRAETDPRRAVIAAYARMERALGAYGLPRGPAEAPEEYLQRIFSDLEVSRLATSRLTALFAWAKFSSHDVAPEMKQQAIEALEAVREELRAAEILAEHERVMAVARFESAR